MRSDFSLNNFIHVVVVECPCVLLVVKYKYISIYQLQFCNIACVRDYKPLLYKKCRCTNITVALYRIFINPINYVLKLFCFVLVCCSCMAINVSVQHNGGFLPGIILLTQ